MARPSQARVLSNSCHVACSANATGRRKEEITSSSSSTVTAVNRLSSPTSSTSSVTSVDRSSASPYSSTSTSSHGHSGYLRVVKGPRAFTPCDSAPSKLKSNPTSLSTSKLKVPCSNIMLTPGPAKKLDRMLSLIPCAEAQFHHDAGASRIEFSYKNSPRALRLVKTARLRSLMALAHYFHELDLRRAMNSCPDAPVT